MGYPYFRKPPYTGMGSIKSAWWLPFFIFHIYIYIYFIIPIDEIMFRGGGSTNHQPVIDFHILRGWLRNPAPPKGWNPIHNGMFTTVFNWWFGFRNIHIRRFPALLCVQNWEFLFLVLVPGLGGLGKKFHILCFYRRWYSFLPHHTIVFLTVP